MATEKTQGVISPRELSEQLVEEFYALPDGAKVPSEHQLAQRYDVTRAFVRSVMDMLVERHLVRRVQGAGTFINRPIDFTISREHPPSFHATVQAQGHTAKTLLVDVAKVQAPEDIAVQLGRKAGDPLTKITRVGWVDDRVARCSYEWLLPEILSEVSAAFGAVESLHEILRMSRFEPIRGRTTVSTAYPPPVIEDYLELSKPQPTWQVETLSHDSASRAPLMVSRTWSRQDILRVVVEW